MSATQPDVPADSPASTPQFPLVLRGYDRHLVDTRVAELVEQLNKERERSHQAEEALQQLQLDIKAGRQLPQWFANLGAEVRQVGEQAGIAAETLLGEAGKHAQATVDAAQVEAADRVKAAEAQANSLEETARKALEEAQTERARIQAEATAAAEETRAQADRDASAILAKAHEEATLAWQKAARERVLLEAEAERLTTLRRRMVEQLGQVYAPLGLTLVDTRRELDHNDEGPSEPPTGQLDAPATASDVEHRKDDESARPENQDSNGY
jgi:hypothetical protein